MGERFPLNDALLLCHATGHGYPGEGNFIIAEADKTEFAQPTSIPCTLTTWGLLPEAPPGQEDY